MTTRYDILLGKSPPPTVCADRVIDAADHASVQEALKDIQQGNIRKVAVVCSQCSGRFTVGYLKDMTGKDDFKQVVCDHLLPMWKEFNESWLEHFRAEDWLKSMEQQTINE
jgi:hypothetical protein